MNKKFENALEKWWTERAKDINKSLNVDPITLRGLFYLLRQKVGTRNMPTSGIYNAVERLEEKTKIPREKLKVISEPKINVITREGETPILKADLNELGKACAIIYIEKSTIIEAIEEDKSLTDRGIYIIKAMGFSTKETNKIIKKAQDLGIPILTLTDFDPSGILIDMKISQCGVKTTRLGVDPALVKALNLKIEDVREPIPKAKRQAHLKYLKTNYPKIAAEFTKIGVKGIPHRIEIDAIFALAGKDRFIEEILKRADLCVPVKKVQKALKYKRVPKKVDDLRQNVHNLVDELFTKAAEKAEDKVKDSQDSFNKIRLSQKEGQLQQVIDGKAEAPATQVLEETIKQLQKLLEEQKKKEAP